MNDSIEMDAGQAVEGRGCPECGSEKIQTSIEADKFAYGTSPDAPQLTVRVPVRTCLDCGFQFTDEEAEDARHEAVCRHLGVLAPTEVRQIRKRYGLSRPEFATLTRLGEASLARWESGSLIQSGAHDRFLRLLGFRENVERLKDMSQALTVRQTDAGAAVPSGSGSAQAVRRFRHLANPDRHRRMASGFVLRPGGRPPKRRESCT